MLNRPHLIGSEIFRRTGQGSMHPLASPKASAMIDLIRALGWLDEDIYIDSPKATPARLRRFHKSAYIDAVMDFEASQSASPEVRQRYGIGTDGNPIFHGVISRAATACGATIKAVQLLADGELFTAHRAEPTTHSPQGPVVSAISTTRCSASFLCWIRG